MSTATIAANVKRVGKARISGASKAKIAANVNRVWQAQISGKQAQIDGAMLGMTQQQTIAQPTTVFSVWDGDWALLEEYDSSGNLFEGYVQGYHGLVKTLVSNIYYYQDELGSTSHIADSTGHLLENYLYNQYGKPTYLDASGNPLPQGSNYNVRDLFTGQRFVTEIGLYDDRNRFMSPDLGRFLQPDPIGFKGDASNLYRYCGNDWANRSDPMGTNGDQDDRKRIMPETQANGWLIKANDLAKLQALVNLKMGLGYGATAVAGLQNQISNLSMATQNLSFAQADSARSLEGTNSKLAIHAEDTGFSAAKGLMDKGYDVAKQTKDREMMGPMGQVDGSTSGRFVAGPYGPGIGKIPPGKPHAGDQGSYIDNLTANLPVGTHLVGYYTVHIHYDPSVLKHTDAPIFKQTWGIQPKIWMISPGRGGLGGNWERPEYSAYPASW